MKHIRAPIFALVSLLPSPALSEDVTKDDLVERDALYYKQFTDVPFTGKLTGKSQGSMKNGKYNVSWLFFYSSGSSKSLLTGNYRTETKASD